jgi:hypothetical protein
MNAQHSTENLTIHYKVKDYTTNGRVFRSAEDPNDVLILQDVTDGPAPGSAQRIRRPRCIRPASLARPTSASRPEQQKQTCSRGGPWRDRGVAPPCLRWR